MQVVEEINLLKKFSNPHIIRFIEAFESPGEVIIIIFTKEGWIKSGNPDKPSVIVHCSKSFLWRWSWSWSTWMEENSLSELLERISTSLSPTVVNSWNRFAGFFSLFCCCCCCCWDDNDDDYNRGVSYLHDHNIVHLDLKVSKNFKYYNLTNL